MNAAKVEYGMDARMLILCDLFHVNSKVENKIVEEVCLLAVESFFPSSFRVLSSRRTHDLMR